MANLQASSILTSFCCASSSLSFRRGTDITAKINIPNIRTNKISLPRLIQRRGISEHEQLTFNTIKKQINNSPTKSGDMILLAVEKLYAIKEAVADRVEMHRNIGEQRSQWNSMLLTSINGIILAAATMVGVAATSGDSVLGLKMSSTLLYLAATGMLIIMNKIQPSQLAEEQRKATSVGIDRFSELNKDKRL